MAITIEFPDRVARQLLLGRVDPATKRALRKAGATAQRDMRAETSKRVRARKRVKVRAVNDAVKIRRGRGNGLEWAVDVHGKPLRVADYPHRQTKKGVSVEINRGKRSLIAHAFKASMRSGHKGVFVRRGNRRLPIDEKLASRVIDAASYQETQEAVLARGRTSFETTFARVWPLEMGKAT